MKSFLYILTILAALTLAGPDFSRAEDLEPDYREFTDIIYEWSSNGDMIQIGDITISYIKSVWSYDGQRDAQGRRILVHASKYDIEVGKLATPLMLEKDREGFWIAEKLILYTGKGLEEALKNVPNTAREYSDPSKL